MTTPPLLVNGANGALGSRLCRLIETRGLPCVAGVRRPRNGGNGEQFLIDSDGHTDAARLGEFGAVINCAGIVRGTPDELARSNIRHAIALATVAKAAGVPVFVQVASFSAYGSADVINASTPEAPNSDYGRSKLQADRELHRLADDRFKVVSVRLPFMFDRAAPGAMGGLIKAFRKSPAFPVAGRSIGRSMATYGHAAAELLAATSRERSEILCAADPAPFRYERLRELMRANGLASARLLAIPAGVQNLIGVMSPKIANRLFHSSLLAPEFNAASPPSKADSVEANVIALLQGPVS